jgi:hypothetical protein
MDWPQTVAEPPDYRSIILPDRVRLDFDQYFTSLYLEWLVDLGVYVYTHYILKLSFIYLFHHQSNNGVDGLG